MDKIKRCFASVFASGDELGVSYAKAPNTALFVWFATMTYLFSQYLDSTSKEGYLDAALFCGVGFIFSVLGFMCLYYFFFHNRKTGITFIIEAITTFACFAWASGLTLEPSERGRLFRITLIAYLLSFSLSLAIDRLVRYASTHLMQAEPQQEEEEGEQKEAEEKDETEESEDNEDKTEPSAQADPDEEGRELDPDDPDEDTDDDASE